MTQGRFDAVPNCRPVNWDVRRHWAKAHHLPCFQDHMERESCPFHDLRACGQFQYEYCGAGVGGQLVLPDRLVKRSDASNMKLGAAAEKQLPYDSENGRPQLTLKRDVDGRPWSHVSRMKNGLFSMPPYIPQGAASKRGATSQSTAARSFSCGSRSVPAIGLPVPHISEPFNDKIDRGRVFHFKAGHAAPLADSRTLHHPCPPSEAPKRRAEGPFYAGKSLGSTFSGPAEHLPEPYDSGKVRNEKRPLFTWYTHTKVSMPVDAPWSTGKVTAEGIKGDSLDLSRSQAPFQLASGSFQHTIGKEAALLPKPEPVRFR